MQVCAVIQGLSGERSALAAYVLRTLLGTLGLPFEVVTEPPPSLDGRMLVWYGPSAPTADAAAVVEIPCLEPLSVEAAVRQEADAWMVTGDGARQRVDGDLIWAAGLWLTGADELDEARDEHGRVCGALTARGRAGLLAVPLVSDLMQVLWLAMRRSAGAGGLPLVRKGFWPAGYGFAVLLSHDVDLWRKRTLRQLAKETLKSLAEPWRLGGVARAFRGGGDPWSDLDGIADLEAARGMHSTFFLLPGRRHRTVGGVRVVGGYGADTGAVEATARRLVERGWEVGLHGSFGSHSSAEALAAERRDVEALSGETVLGGRQHFLRFERPTTWRCQAEAGLTYDATLGYHDEDGYRAGFSFPFHPFDGEELPLLELPLVVMDGVLRERKGLDAVWAWRRVEDYLERTRADGAMCSLLWHNHYFCDLDAPGYRGVYERALDWIRDRGGWGASGRDLCRWWLAREAATLDVQAGAGETRVVISAPEGITELPLEIAHAGDVAFEACRGAIVERDERTARVVVRELVPGASAVVLRTGRG